MRGPHHSGNVGHAGAPIVEPRFRSSWSVEGRGCGLGVLSCGRDCEDPTEIDMDRVHKRQVTPPPEFSVKDQHDGGSLQASAIYSTAEPQPLVGEVLRKEQVWMLCLSSDGTETIERGDLSLHANGLRFQRTDAPWGKEEGDLEILLVPFAFVRPVAMQSSALQDIISPVPFAKILSITLFLDGRTHLFGFCAWEEDKAQELCMWWVRDIARSIRWVSESLFTHGSCFQTPLSNGSQEGQLMTGYLLHSDPGEKVRAMYVELQPPQQGKGRLALYTCSGGGREIDIQVVIDARTPSYEKVGFDCSCFSIGTLQLSARTVFERQLWLRAVQNLKVKLQSRGPDPRTEELDQWREAINEHIRENADKLRNKVHVSDHKATSAVFSIQEPLEADEAALAGTAEKFRGLPLLRRCGPHSDDEIEVPGSSTQAYNDHPHSGDSHEKGMIRAA